MKKFWIVLAALIVMNASSPVFAEGFFNFGKKDKKVKEVKQEVKKEMKKIEAKSEEAENKDEKAEPLKYEKSSLVEVKEYEEGEGEELARIVRAPEPIVRVTNNPNLQNQQINYPQATTVPQTVVRAPKNPNIDVPRAPTQSTAVVRAPKNPNRRD